MVKKRTGKIGVIAMVSPETHSLLAQYLAALDLDLLIASDVADFLRALRAAQAVAVVIIPAVLPDAGWWPLWGELSQRLPRPEILVYAHTASFQLWSGVIEAGASDLIEEPFTERELRDAVSRAIRNFKARVSGESASPGPPVAGSN